MCGGVNLAMDFLFDEWAMLVQLDSKHIPCDHIVWPSLQSCQLYNYWGIDLDLKMICLQVFPESSMGSYIRSPRQILKISG